MAAKKKTCTECRGVLPLDRFAYTRAGRQETICRGCRIETSRLRRLARRAAVAQPGCWEEWNPFVLSRRVHKLLAACVAARGAGTWRGRDAIRAYSLLADELAAFGVDPYEADLRETLWTK